ncbi:MAG TPA: APC family permease [Candidatus Bathyarchaeia archaeon]|nr:APC family permease [Candidatus Bathyarchaeia archaeon]
MTEQTTTFRTDHPEHAKLKKDLGLLGLTAVAVGGMIGSGIFSLPAVMASVAGPSFLYGLLLTGILVAFLALPYTELGSAFPITGGPYALPRLAFGDFGGFTMGWAYFLYAFIGTAAIIDIFVTYLNYYIPGLAVGLTLTPLGIAVAIIFLWAWTALNILGVKWGGLYAIVTTFGKLIPLLLFAGIGLMYLNFGNFSNQFPFGFTGIGLAMSLGFFSFTGFEAVVIPSQEVKNPGRNIPLAMILTIVIVTAVYMFVSFAFTGMVNWTGLGLKVGDWVSIGNLSSPFANVGAALGLPILAAVAIVGAVISTAGSGGDWVLLQGRIPFAMAADKLFFKSMGKVDEKRGTPIKALIFASALTMIIQILIPNFPSAALVASITTLVPYAAAALALPVLRKNRPEVNRPVKGTVCISSCGGGFCWSLDFRLLGRMALDHRRSCFDDNWRTTLLFVQTTDCWGN